MVVPSENDIKPKRFGLKFNPPTLILEYLVPSTGKLFQRRMCLHITKLQKMEPRKVAEKLREKNMVYLSEEKIDFDQILELVTKLVQHARNNKSPQNLDGRDTEKSTLEGIKSPKSKLTAICEADLETDKGSSAPDNNSSLPTPKKEDREEVTALEISQDLLHNERPNAVISGEKNDVSEDNISEDGQSLSKEKDVLEAEILKKDSKNMDDDILKNDNNGDIPKSDSEHDADADSISAAGNALPDNSGDETEKKGEVEKSETDKIDPIQKGGLLGDLPGFETKKNAGMFDLPGIDDESDNSIDEDNISAADNSSIATPKAENDAGPTEREGELEKDITAEDAEPVNKGGLLGDLPSFSSKPSGGLLGDLPCLDAKKGGGFLGDLPGLHESDSEHGTEEDSIDSPMATSKIENDATTLETIKEEAEPAKKGGLLGDLPSFSAKKGGGLLGDLPGLESKNVGGLFGDLPGLQECDSEQDAEGESIPSENSSPVEQKKNFFETQKSTFLGDIPEEGNESESDAEQNESIMEQPPKAEVKKSNGLLGDLPGFGAPKTGGLLGDLPGFEFNKGGSGGWANKIPGLDSEPESDEENDYTFPESPSEIQKDGLLSDIQAGDKKNGWLATSPKKNEPLSPAHSNAESAEQESSMITSPKMNPTKNLLGDLPTLGAPKVGSLLGDLPGLPGVKSTPPINVAADDAASDISFSIPDECDTPSSNGSGSLEYKATGDFGIQKESDGDDLEPEKDLTKVTTEELDVAKKQMDVEFYRNLKKPGDQGYEYDIRVDYPPATANCGWDSD